MLGKTPLVESVFTTSLNLRLARLSLTNGRLIYDRIVFVCFRQYFIVLLIFSGRQRDYIQDIPANMLTQTRIPPFIRFRGT